MFETFASLIKFGCEGQPAMAETFEKAVMVPFQQVLAQDIEEFSPYVFQIFAQIVSLRPQPLPELYTMLYDGVVQADMWKRTGNIPALNSLLQAFVQKAPAIVGAKGLQPVLGIMHHLVGSKANDHEGLNLFSGLFTNIDAATLDAFLPQVFQIFMQRLMKGRTVKYTHALIKCLSTFISIHSASLFISKMEAAAQGCFQQIMEQVWLPETQKLQSLPERKACGYAMVKLLEDPQVQSNGVLWIAIFSAVMKLIEMPVEKAADDGEDIDFIHQDGYDTAYSKLHFANSSVDVTEKLPDTRQALVSAKDNMAKCMPMIQTLPPDAQTKLSEYFQAAGVRFP
jgi:exportin-2 (importin alpha re-exporter)